MRRKKTNGAAVRKKKAREKLIEHDPGVTYETFRVYDWPNHQFLHEGVLEKEEAREMAVRTNRSGVSAVPVTPNGKHIALSGDRFSLLFDLYVHDGVPANGPSLMVTVGNAAERMSEKEMSEADDDVAEAAKL